MVEDSQSDHGKYLALPQSDLKTPEPHIALELFLTTAANYFQYIRRGKNRKSQQSIFHMKNILSKELLKDPSYLVLKNARGIREDG